MFSKKTIILIFILFSTLAVFAVVFLNDEYSASARRAAFEADRTRYMSDILRITNGVMPVLWIEPKYSYESNAKYFDLSGNANHATQSTTDYQPAVNPPGLKFDGGNDYVDCGNDASLDIMDAITVEAWVKPADISTGSYVRRDGDGATYGWFLLRQVSGNFQLQLLDHAGANISYVNSNADVEADKWFHIVATSDRTTIKIYINGVFDNSVVDNTSDVLGESVLVIGAIPAASEYFNGSIDSVRIYNIALTPAQIQNLYLAGLPGHR